jgi:hypothetical protein
MKRLAVFALLGPALGLVPVMFVGALAFTVLPVVLFVAYVIGIVPALLACIVDWLLSSRLSREVRLVLTAGAGAAFSLLPAFVGNNIAHTPREFLLLAVAGGFSAATCSWLSGQRKTRQIDEEEWLRFRNGRSLSDRLV